MKYPHLLLVSEFAPPDTGGIERYLDELTREWVRAGGAVTARLSPGHALDGARVLTGELFSWRWMRPSYLPLLWNLPRWRRAANADVVLFGHASNALLVAPIAAAFGRFPYVVLVHGMDVRRMPHWLARWSLSRARAVLANSRATARFCIGLGIPESKVVVVPPGTTLPNAPSSRRDRHHGLTVGRLVARKGFATLLKAVAEAKRNVPDLTLTIVGEGREREALKALAVELGLADSARFAGRIEDTALAELRDQVGWFALVPEQTEDASDVEGFGVALLEAQAAGLPVITANAGGVGDAVAPDAAVRVAPGDVHGIAQAMVDLSTNAQVADRMAKEARRWASANATWAERIAMLRTAVAKDLTATATIGVVVPAYNAERSLASTLRSIRRQRGVTTDVVVVDDGSQDATARVARSLGVAVLRQVNGGAPRARNAGAAAVSGEFLFFCDADVKLHPDALFELLHTLLTHPDAAFAYCSFQYGVRPHRCGPFDAERLRRSNYISTMSLVRRSVFPGFDPDLARLQDWDLWLTVVERGGRGIWVPRYLFSATPQQKGISGRLGGPPPNAAVQRVQRKHSV